MLKILFNIRKFCVSSTSSKIKMKYLNVAEKNDAAKTIAGLLSNGSSRRRDGLSVYNKIYEFQTQVRGQQSDMLMTSVSGHLLTYEFVSSYKHWEGCDPIQLFSAPVVKNCPENFVKIKQSIQKEVRGCQGLIIWTDCDREGENIGFEIIQVVREIKPNISVYRAKFSEITFASIRRALDNLVQPDERINNAVDVRMELDLRIGAAFTRFQTLRFQRVFPTQVENKLVSYGSCQFPTLGFVAQRYKEAENFIPQTFWRIKMTHTVNELTVEFTWARKRLFDKQCCEAFLAICQANPKALVTNVTEKPKSKWRPTPMDTIELEKLGSRKLKITAKETMTIAEKLYSQGIISYPRTETNIFSKEIDLRSLVERQTPHPQWGGFATKVLEWGPNPRQGKKSDQAHPPIHPTKFTTSLGGNEQRVYELIVRHFLACVSRDANGSETIAYVSVADEEFSANGLCIFERNYLEVYPYDRWNAKEIHAYKRGNTFDPTEISMPEGTTTAPQMLTEADLIALMEKHGIGTDATHAEHINTIKERGYIGELERGFLVPGTLGMGLVEGYDAINMPLAQPKLRAELEVDLKLICEGRRNPQEVLAEQIVKYRDAYKVITEKALELDRSLGARLNETPRDPPPPPTSQQIQEVFKCPKCDGYQMVIRNKKDNAGQFISCLGYPGCKNAIWLPMDVVKEVKGTEIACPRCGPNTKKLSFTFKNRSTLNRLGAVDEVYTTCLICDTTLRNILNINDDAVPGVVTNRVPQVNGITRPTTTRNIGGGTMGPPPSRPPPNRPPPNRPPNNGSNNFRSDGHDPDAGGERIQQNSTRNVGWFANDANPPPPPTRPSVNTTSSWGNPSNETRHTSNNSSWGGGGNQTTSSWGNPAPPQNQGGWISSTTNRPNDAGNRNVNQNPNASFGDDVKCTKCNQSATRLIVKKDGPNKGRPFYTCKNSDQCNFFKWGDENEPPSGGNFSGGGGGSWSSGSGSSVRSSGPNENDSTANRKRKCGLCRQEGHTKLKCPRRSELEIM